MQYYQLDGRNPYLIIIITALKNVFKKDMFHNGIKDNNAKSAGAVQYRIIYLLLQTA